MHNAIAFTLLISISLGVGCKTERPIPHYDLVDGPPSNWAMSADDAVLAATDYCVRDGIDLSVHSSPRIVCDSLDGDRFWCIAYDGFTRIPGDHFMLLINDETGAVEYVAGE
ncbi:MAG: hypothetical protein ACF787_03100 [Rhodopirellula sp. JB053]